MDGLDLYLTKETPNFVLLISFILMVLAIAIIMIISKESKQTRKWVVCTLLVEYTFLVLSETVIFRSKLGDYKINLEPLWSYKHILGESSMIMTWEVLLNIFLFIPIGLMIGMLSSHVQWWKVLIFSVILSSSIEISQYIFRKGLCETDDVIHNVLGALLGYGIYNTIKYEVKHFKKQVH